ncbi:lig_chan-Glu_bd domain-containing protein [Caerostris extrusa]|uniref:Lig_chan-Glu_bd domain-containing protein n=1 Tax=Caerostris extrusa TaxID=172846 RepID=A0AAV4SGG3_CAEEX|nr:lig_chan-Glu_bd domain-containing protein [Caerostris extrusa]
MMGQIQKGEADLAFNSISITESRNTVADFSTIYAIDDMTFIIEKPGAYPTSLAFIRPFDSTLWNITLVILFLMPLVMKLLLSTKDTYIHMFLKLLGSVLRQPTISDRDFGQKAYLLRG